MQTCNEQQDIDLCENAKGAYMHLNELPLGFFFSNFGGGLFGRCFLTQSMRNCLGDLPVHCCLVYSKLRTFPGAATTVTVFSDTNRIEKSRCINTTDF